VAQAAPSDVIVVGGGITGAGIALDAASRGLSVTLLESRDMAYGTSRWSSKLVHGGLRYLAKGDVAVAWESARERAHLMGTIAPHLIRALPHVLPVLAEQSNGRMMALRVGLAGADTMRRMARTPRGALGSSRRLSVGDVVRLAPTVDAGKIRGGIGFFDGQLVDDARLVISVTRTAAAYGARILTRMRVTDIDGGTVVAHDELNGGTHTFRARHVIVATGVWSGQWDPSLPLRLSRGTHVLLRPESLGDLRAALTVPIAGSNSRFVFALPQPQGPVIAGLTDVEVSGVSPDNTAPPEDEIAWVMKQLSVILQRPLTTADVVGAYSGFRPLVDASADADTAPAQGTADVSRRHLIHRREDGVVVITGGKLTTYRTMAADALDALGMDAMAKHGHRRSRTADIPLVGAPGGPRVTAFATTPVAANRHHSVDRAQEPLAPTHVTSPHVARWRQRYGSEAKRLADIALSHPDYAGEIPDSGGITRAEIVHAITCEGALTVDDIVQRRTRVALQPELLASARPVIAAFAREIDPHIIDREVD
jgi:glycerol-3-phosphate dehydrogenase